MKMPPDSSEYLLCVFTCADRIRCLYKPTQNCDMRLAHRSSPKCWLI